MSYTKEEFDHYKNTFLSNVKILLADKRTPEGFDVKINNVVTFFEGVNLGDYKQLDNEIGLITCTKEFDLGHFMKVLNNTKFLWLQCIK